jgi:hypothetical protein
VHLVLAHQGGWDEMLMVLAPIVVIVFLLRVAKRRGERLQPDAGAVEDDDEA